MFGRGKMYKQGLADAMRAYEGFSEKQQVALEKMRQEVASGGKRLEDALAGLGDDLNGIYQFLNSREKAALYSLESQMDIKDLEDPERQYLVSCLYQLATDIGERMTDCQRTFIRSVQRYAEITNPQTSADLTAVGDIDSLEVQKLFLRVALEFFYLQEDDDYTEVQEDFLSGFSVNKKQAAVIENSVSRLYNAVGAEGIAEKYGYVPEPEEDDISNTDKGITEHFGLISPVLKEFIFNDTNRDIPVGEERLFENMRVIFPKQLHVDGKVVFKNCEIVLDYDGTCTIVVKECGVVEFLNCEFVVKKQAKAHLINITGKCLIKDSKISQQVYRYGEGNDVFENNEGAVIYNYAFIDVDGYDSMAVLTMEHCLVENCIGTFINADGAKFGRNNKVVLSGCQIMGHTGNFLIAVGAYEGSDAGVVITDCTFADCKPEEENEDFIFLSYPNGTPRDRLIKAHSEPLRLENSYFYSARESLLDISSFDDDIRIVNCIFEDFIQAYPIVGTIEGCTFRRLVKRSYSILLFGQCNGYVDKETIVRDSVFQEIYGDISVEYGKIEHCVFENSEMMLFVLGKGEPEPSYISKASDLTFINCSVNTQKHGIPYYEELDLPALIQVRSYRDKDYQCVSILGCKFKNCTIPGGGKAVNTKKRTAGSFNRIKVLNVGSESSTVIV